MSVDISIIIVNYNVCDMLCACLDSIQRQKDCRYEVFVVDNASADDSVAKLRADYPWVNLTASKKNLGFAGGNNCVLEETAGRYIYYLNPDTVLPEDDVLSRICAYMDAHSSVGLASTRLVYGDGSDQQAVKYKYDEQRCSADELSGLPGDICWVIGASMVTRRELMMETGGFDERFFIYGEDEDLCLSVRKLGREIGFIDDITVVHYQGQSEKKTPDIELERKKLDSSLIFYRKHYTADTIARIRRRRLREARVKRLQLRLRRLLNPTSQRIRHRMDRFRLEQEMFRNFN